MNIIESTFVRWLGGGGKGGGGHGPMSPFPDNNSTLPFLCYFQVLFRRLHTGNVG